MKTLKKGDKVTYKVTDPWGKTWEETGTVIMVYKGKALLDTGKEIFGIIRK